jgi:Fe-S cluster assembly protein SufD
LEDDMAIETIAGFAFDKDATAPGPSWLQSVRHQSWERFAQLGLPTTRHEEWKYTSLAPLQRFDFVPAPSGDGEITADAVARLTLEALPATRLVFVNGRYSARLSQRGELPESVRVETLAAAWDRQAPFASELAAQVTSLDPHRWPCQQRLFRGAYIEVPRGVVLPGPWR